MADHPVVVVEMEILDMSDRAVRRDDHATFESLDAAQHDAAPAMPGSGLCRDVTGLSVC
jgi:hypothetical protein